MNYVDSATTQFNDGQELHLAAVGAGELAPDEPERAYIYHQTRPGQQRRTMQRWDYRTIHDGLAAYNAKVKRLARGESIT